MEQEEVIELLEAAAEAAEEYAEKTVCSWCARKAQVMSEALRDLKHMHVLGVDFVKALAEKEALPRVDLEAEWLKKARKVAEGKNPTEEEPQQEQQTKQNYSLIPGREEVEEFLDGAIGLLIPADLIKGVVVPPTSILPPPPLPRRR